MITVGGSAAIGNALAQSLGASIAVGVGESAPSTADSRLDFEVFRAPVRIRTYDATTQRLVLAASLPESLDVTISEVGIFSNQSDASGLLTTFDSVAEGWTGGTWNSTNARLGETALNIALGSAVLADNPQVAISNVRMSDILQVAYFGAGGNVEVRIENSPADYYRYTFTPAAGYNVSAAPISSLVKVGNPDLASASGLRITHSGSGSVTLDGIRVHSQGDDDNLILRQRFATPLRKIVGMPLDIEVPMVINL